MKSHTAQTLHSCSRALLAVAFLVVLAVVALLIMRKVRRVPAHKLAGVFPLKDFFIELNGGVSRLAGRRWCNNVYRSPDKMLLTEHKGNDPIAAVAENATAFVDQLKARGISYLYVQAPAKIDMGGAMLPDGFVHNGNARADAFLDALARNGIRTFDLRQMLSATPEDVVRNFYRTDHHWNNDAVFKVFGVLARHIAEEIGCAPTTVEAFISPDGWDREIWPHCFQGSSSRRTGWFFGGIDDMIVYTPRFSTEMTFEIPSRGIAISGDFRKTVMCRADEVRTRRAGAQVKAYSLVYAGVGGSYDACVHKNQNAPLRKRLLIVGDSFARPLEGLLSTVFSHVLALDQRCFSSGETVAGFVEAFKPDVVLQLNNPFAFGREGGSHRSVLFEYGSFKSECRVRRARPEGTL